MQKKALVSDFDGTITKKDFFWIVVDELLTPEDVKPWQLYLKGEITHIEALRRIFAKIRLTPEEFHDFILSMQIQDGFLETIDFCSKNGIDFFIVSAGADYYIKLILEHNNLLNKVTLFSNKSIYCQNKGLQILPADEQAQFYSYNYGINKKTVVESIMQKYHPCIFAGDGGPDIEAAQTANYVFARERLLELCEELNIKATKFDSYCDILNYLRNSK